MMFIPTVPTTYIEWLNYVEDAQKGLEQAAFSLSSGIARKQYAELLLENFADKNASFAVLEDQLSSIGSLKEGWDSYDAPAPARGSIANARHAIGKLRSEQLLPETVAPSAEGGVSIYFSQGKQKAFIEFLNEGGILLARYGKDDEPHVEVLRNGLQDLNDQALQAIRNHLGARA
jgi:hypothetical protein